MYFDIKTHQSFIAYNESSAAHALHICTIGIYYFIFQPPKTKKSRSADEPETPKQVKKTPKQIETPDKLRPPRFPDKLRPPSKLGPQSRLRDLQDQKFLRSNLVKQVIYMDCTNCSCIV